MRESSEPPASGFRSKGPKLPESAACRFYLNSLTHDVPLETILALARAADEDALWATYYIHTNGQRGVLLPEVRLAQKSAQDFLEKKKKLQIEDEEDGRIWEHLKESEIVAVVNRKESKKSMFRKIVEGFFQTKWGHLFFDFSSVVIGIITALLNFPIPLSSIAVWALSISEVVFLVCWIFWDLSIILKNVIKACYTAKLSEKCAAMKEAFYISWTHEKRRERMFSVLTWVVAAPIILLLSLLILKLDLLLDPTGTASLPVKLTLNHIITVIVFVGFLQDHKFVATLAKNAIGMLKEEHSALENEIQAIDEMLDFFVQQEEMTSEEIQNFFTPTVSVQDEEDDKLKKTLIFNKIRSLLNACPDTTLEDIQDELKLNLKNYLDRQEQIEKDLAYEQIVQFREKSLSKMVVGGGILCLMGTLIGIFSVICPPLMILSVLLLITGTSMFILPYVVVIANKIFEWAAEPQTVRRFWTRTLGPLMVSYEENMKDWKQLFTTMVSFFRRLWTPAPETPPSLNPGKTCHGFFNVRCKDKKSPQIKQLDEEVGEPMLGYPRSSGLLTVAPASV